MCLHLACGISHKLVRRSKSFVAGSFLPRPSPTPHSTLTLADTHTHTNICTHTHKHTHTNTHLLARCRPPAPPPLPPCWRCRLPGSRLAAAGPGGRRPPAAWARASAGHGQRQGRPRPPATIMVAFINLRIKLCIIRSPPRIAAAFPVQRGQRYKTLALGAAVQMSPTTCMSGSRSLTLPPMPRGVAHSPGAQHRR